MSQQIYRFIKFLEQKEGRKPPLLAVYKYDIENLKEEDYIDMLFKDAKFINYIIEKRIPLTNEMMFAAASNNGNILGVIKNYLRNKYSRTYLPLKELSPEELEKIKIPENVQLAAVKNNGVSIQNIDNPSEEIQLAAISRNRDAFNFIKNPTENVQIYNIEKNGVYGVNAILNKNIEMSPRVKEAAYNYFISRNIKIPEYLNL